VIACRDITRTRDWSVAPAYSNRHDSSQKKMRCVEDPLGSDARWYGVGEILQELEEV
jgi:hypothetical protein